LNTCETGRVREKEFRTGSRRGLLRKRLLRSREERLGSWEKGRGKIELRKVCSYLDARGKKRRTDPSVSRGGGWGNGRATNACIRSTKEISPSSKKERTYEEKGKGPGGCIRRGGLGAEAVLCGTEERNTSMEWFFRTRFLS